MSEEKKQETIQEEEIVAEKAEETEVPKDTTGESAGAG